MFLSKIIINGFKCYRDKVVADNLDKHFNAIIGKNGSGKSNFFDAICFALGHRSNSSMRIDSVEDFIYKKGTANIKVATVELIFNNKDKVKSATQWIERDHVSISRMVNVKGKNKFFVNNRQIKVTDLHQILSEVGLNMRCSNYLVMQGRIQEIASNKPIHLYEYFGETIGTCIFTREREKFQKTLSEKESILNSIKEDLNDSLEPTYQMCLKQKNSYKEWIQIRFELQYLKVILRKRLLDEIHQSKVNKQEFVESCKNRIQSTLNELKSLEQRDTELDNNIKMQEKRLDDCRSNFNYDQVSKLLQDKTNQLLILSDTRNDVSSKLESAKNSLIGYQNNLNEAEQKLSEHIKNNYEVIEKLKCLKQQICLEDRNVKSLKEQLDAASRGILLNEELLNVRELCDELQDNIISHKDLLSKYELELASVNKHLSSADVNVNSNEINSMAQKKADLNDEVNEIKRKLGIMSDHTDQLTAAQQELDTLSKRKTQLEKTLDSAKKRFSRELTLLSEFNDRSIVDGLVLDCFKISDEFKEFELALEESARVRLLNLIVKDEHVAISVFNYASSRNIRITCIPLSKMNTSCAVDNSRKANNKNKQDNLQSAIDTARKLGDVYLYSDLISYDPKYESVFKYVFRDCFFSRSTTSAQLLFNDKGWTYKIITLDGTTYNPSGKLAGGNAVGLNKLIEAYRDLKALPYTVSELTTTLNNVKANYQKISYDSIQRETLERKLAFTESTLKNTVQALEQAYLTSEAGKITLWKEEKALLEQKILECRKELTEYYEMYERYQQELSKFNRQNEKYRNDLKTKLSKANARYDELTSEKQRLSDVCGSMYLLEMQKLENNISGLKKSLIDTTDLVASLEKQKIELETKYNDLRQDFQVENKFAEAKFKELEDVESALKQLNNQRVFNESAMKTLKSKLDELDASLSATYREIELLDEQNEENTKTLNALCKSKEDIMVDNSDLLSDSMLSQLDEKYKALSYDEIDELINMAEKKKKELQAVINLTAIDSLSVIEKQRETILSDQAKIFEEKEKLENLVKSIENQLRLFEESHLVELNKNIQLIFSRFFPNSSIVVKPVDDSNLNQGITLEVEFENQKPASLQSLSGGQRTIVSLSFALALLKVAPAPFYIFDEIDAALDISHTDNFGKIIKECFTNSQFIVISHRQAFYSKANKIYRVYCIDNASTITQL